MDQHDNEWSISQLVRHLERMRDGIKPSRVSGYVAEEFSDYAKEANRRDAKLKKAGITLAIKALKALVE